MFSKVFHVNKRKRDLKNFEFEVKSENIVKNRFKIFFCEKKKPNYETRILKCGDRFPDLKP